MASCVRKKAESKREGTPLPPRAAKGAVSSALVSQAFKQRLTITIAGGTIQDIASAVLEAVRVGVAVERAARLAELDHARLEVVERAFYKALLLLVVSEEVVPEGVLWKSGGQRLRKRRRGLRIHLAEDLGVAEDDETVLGSSEGDVETTRIVKETDTLVLVTPHA